MTKNRNKHFICSAGIPALFLFFSYSLTFPFRFSIFFCFFVLFSPLQRSTHEIQRRCRLAHTSHHLFSIVFHSHTPHAFRHTLSSPATKGIFAASFAIARRHLAATSIQRIPENFCRRLVSVVFYCRQNLLGCNFAYSFSMGCVRSRAGG